MLVTNRKYNQEATEIARKVSHLTQERHAKWLISLKYILDQSDVDNTLSRQTEFCESVILKEEERITQNQRLLLECESERVKERREALKDRQKVLSFVVNDIGKAAEKKISATLSNQTPLQLFGRFPDFSYFLDTAYSPSVTYSKLNVLPTNDNRLRENILQLVNNQTFCDRIGKSVRSINDPQMAIGTLGIDNCRLLFPILMVKPLLKWHEAETKTIAPKLWQHMILTANVTRLRLESAEVKNADQGIVLGILRTISLFAVVNQFTALFEDALVERMQFYRSENMREEYYACAEITPNLSILPRIMLKTEKLLTKKVIEHIEWTPNNIHLRNALEEDLNEVPILQRSEWGQALAQAKAYSIFDTLDRSDAFVEKHKPFWFANVQMPPEALHKLRNSHPGRVGLSQ